MDMENLQKLLQMAKEDEKIADKMKEIGYQNLEGLLTYGKELGLDFSDSYLEELKKQVLNKTNELDLAELEKVSGGWLFTNATV